jgi:polyketide synthase 5
VVTAVGPGVTTTRSATGRGISADGAWAAFVTCDANSRGHAAAGVPTIGAARAQRTRHRLYGLHDLARISAGDKVLFHSPTRGVGQAAIAIALGGRLAEFFATEGPRRAEETVCGRGIERATFAAASILPTDPAPTPVATASMSC